MGQGRGGAGGCGLGRMRWARPGRVGRRGWVGWVAVRRMLRLRSRSARRGGRSSLWPGGREPSRPCGAGRLAAARAGGCAERRQRAAAGHQPAAAGARAHGVASQGHHHHTGQYSHRGASPRHGIPWVPGQRGAPPAAAGRLVAARPTHEPPVAPRLPASPHARRRRPHAFPPCDQGWQRQCSNGEPDQSPKPANAALLRWSIVTGGRLVQ